MKAHFTSFLLAFLLPFFVSAQDSAAVEPYRFTPFGTAALQAGVNVSSLTSFNRQESRLGLHVGLTGEYRFSPLLGIATGITYSQQGTQLNNFEFGLNYLQLPLLLTLHDDDFLVQAGFYGGVLLKARTLGGRISEDVTRHFKPTETGICLGLFYSFFGNTFMGLRYYHGLQNINHSLTDSRLYLRNSTLQVTAGYTF